MPGWLNGDDELMTMLMDHYLAGILAAHYRRPYTRLWMNWYRDKNDGTGWHADRPANELDEAVVPVLRQPAGPRLSLNFSAPVTSA